MSTGNVASSSNPADRRENRRSGERVPTRSLVAWALYDWANTGFATVVQTFLLVTYFTRRVASDETSGSSLWGYAIAVAGVTIAATAPVLGAIADQAGRRKPWIAGATLSCCAACASLWFVKPDPSYVWLALALLVIGSVSLDLANVFYNAMLPGLVAPSRIGRWSGWGWGLGYAGGLACLALALFVFVSPQHALFDLGEASGHRVRAAFPLVAVWFALFSLPLFLLTPDAPRSKPLKRAVRDGLRQLRDTFRTIREHALVLRFLVARMIYTDGTATLFALGGAYAAAIHDMNEAEVLWFGIAVNVFAGAGAFGFGWIDDRLGPRRTILLSVLGLATSGTVILLAQSERFFWLASFAAGLFVGPIHSASRSFLSRVVPRQLVNQTFGLYALSGKATAALGPLLVGWLTFLSGSLRVGMSTIVVFLVAGAAILWTVPNASDFAVDGSDSG